MPSWGALNVRGQQDTLPGARRYCKEIRGLVTPVGATFGWRGASGRVFEETFVVGFIVRMILMICVLAAVGGAIFLATWDMPAPTAQVEKVISADRFK